MVKKSVIGLVFFFFGLVFWPGAGFCDGDKFGLGIRGGWYKAADAENGSLYGGVQARWKLFPALSLEGSLDYREEANYPNNKKITNYPVLVSALFYPIPNAKLSPYFLLGIGWYYSKVEDRSGSSTTNEFGAHLGGGLDIPLNPNITFNADLRYYFLNYEDQKVKDLQTNGFIVSAGLTFYLW